MSFDMKRVLTDLFSLKTQKRQKMALYILCGIDIIGYIIMYYVLEIKTFDHYYYMDAVRSYFETGNCYVHGFVYLDYFCYLFAFFLAPLMVSFFIRLFTNLMICLIFFDIQKKNPSNINLVWWIYANYFLLYNDIIQLNVNTLIPLVFYIFYTYREKHPWTALLLIFCFYKVNSILILGGIYVLDIIFKKRFKDIFKEVLYLIPIAIIVGISLINSIKIGFLDAEYSQGYGINAIIMAFQYQHLFSYTVLLYVLIDKILLKHRIQQTQHEPHPSQSKLNEEKIKQIWKIYFVLLILYTIFSGVVQILN